ncbi:hypothetical protein IQ07DRAFT_596084 [Pyrenochaeta sp. DS3sAY3a]|nr:hypothetical protein IQ07DRAFT_596084 [Pyrenochaeta sp. DS3sAY3a]
MALLPDLFHPFVTVISKFSLSNLMHSSQTPDFRRCQDASIGRENVLALNHDSHKQGTQSLPLQTDVLSYLQVRVILDRGNKDYRYESVSVETKNQGESLMLQLHRIRGVQTTGLRWILTALWNALNMRQDAIWLVTVSLYCTSMHIDEEQMFPPRVLIKDGKCIEYLTPAINNPKVLGSATSFVIDHLDSVIDGGNSNDWFSPKKALCFGKVLSTLAVFTWFGVALSMSIAVACIVGATLKDLQPDNRRNGKGFKIVHKCYLSTEVNGWLKGGFWEIGKWGFDLLFIEKLVDRTGTTKTEESCDGKRLNLVRT